MNTKLSRRAFLKTSVALGISPKVVFAQGSEKNDIRYFRSTRLEDILQEYDSISTLLGPGVSEDMKVVYGRDDKYWLIYQREPQRQHTTEEVRSIHEDIVGGASIIDEGDYDTVYKPLFHTSSDLNYLKDQFEKLYPQLPLELQDKLVIEAPQEESMSGGILYAITIDTSIGDIDLDKLPLVPYTTPFNLNRVIFWGENAELDSDTSQVKKQTDSSEIEELSVKRPVLRPNSFKLEDDISTEKKVFISKKDLEEMVVDYVLSDRRNRGLIGQEQTGWYAYSITNDEEILNINANEDSRFFQMASMVKPFLALLYLSRCYDESDPLTLGPNGDRAMRQSLQVSNNDSTNWLFEQLGGPKEVQERLEQEFPYLAEHTNIVENIPSGGRTYRNKSRLRAYSKLMYQVANNQSSQFEKLREYMGLKSGNRIFTNTSKVDVPQGIEDLPPGTRLYNKTGTTGMCCGDFGLVITPDKHEYIFAGVVERLHTKTPNFSRWMRNRGNLIRGVSRMVYTNINNS